MEFDLTINPIVKCYEYAVQYPYLEIILNNLLPYNRTVRNIRQAVPVKICYYRCPWP